MASYYNDYDKLYPDVIVEVLEYFDINNPVDAVKDKTILKFCELHKSGSEYIYQPQIISRICKRLSECGILECLCNRGGLGLSDNYLFMLNRKEFFQDNRDRLKYYYNSKVYGFDYIYGMYLDLIVPLVWEKENGDYAAGTGFKYLNGIVTAKHCITDVKNLQIKGYKASELEGKPVFISENDCVDIAFIETGENANPLLFTDEGEIMQEVLVMGYPNIPAFTNFLTAEKATISSKASSRITPTRGSIAAYGYEYLAKIDAMLITARIRGGNSGGPVINEYGCLVGVACHIPDCDSSNGDYDDMGYGIAVPVKYVIEIIDKKPKTIEIPKNFYRDFIE